MHNETKRSGFDFSIKTKSRTCRFYHVYNWRDDGSEDRAKEIGGNNYGWPTNSEGLPARDRRRVGGKRHRMVQRRLPQIEPPWLRRGDARGETYEGNSGDAVNGLCAADDARA